MSDKNTKQPANKSSNVEIIAEFSANHLQDLDLAFDSLRAIAKTGVDAVKIQSYDALSLSLPLRQDPFIIRDGTPWDGQTFYDLYKSAAMPWDWHQSLFRLAEQLNIELFSSPFCTKGVELLETLGVKRYKIASFEIEYTQLIHRIAACGKPMIFSLGIADFAAIERVLKVCREEGNEQITLLQCTSAYPAPIEHANLRMIPHLKSTFGTRVGLSDHSLGNTVAIAAVALGAEMIEKHFTLDRSKGGPDSSFSLEPAEFAELVGELRKTEAALGKVDYSLSPAKKKSKRLGRSIFITRDLRQGQALRHEDLEILRPNAGLAPYHLEEVIGARLRQDVSYGTPLSWDLIDLPGQVPTKAAVPQPVSALSLLEKQPSKDKAWRDKHNLLQAADDQAGELRRLISSFQEDDEPPEPLI